MKKIKAKLKSLLKKLVIAYILICVVMFSFQRCIMYHSLRCVVTSSEIVVKFPQEYGLTDFANITLETADGIHVQTWHHPAKGNYPTIIYFHGNGGNLAHRAKFFSILSEAGFGVLGLDYRGYGNSEGSPSEEGIYMDARATINYAIKTLSLPLEKIIIYGESIGTGVATQMATEYKIAALVLQSPFISMEAASKHHYPWLPVSLLLKDRYDSLSKISNINVPILFFHGELDNIVPATQGKELFAKANEPKQALYFPEKGHNNMDLQKLTTAIVEFSKNHKLVD